MRHRKSHVRLGAAVGVTAGLLLAACGGPHKAAAVSAGCKTSRAHRAASTAGAPGSWPYANGDLANTRNAIGSTIASANVSRLTEAWTFKLTGTAAAGAPPYGALTANPIVENGVVYLQDLDSNVYALALATGELEWEYQCNQLERSGPGPNGVAVAGGKVYGLTPTSAFALSASTGRTLWVNRGLLRPGQGTFGIQPQVSGGRVYLASQYGSGPGGGVLIALNASSGALLWKFNTMVGPDPGVRALGLGGGGAWETPLVGRDGSVTYGIGNPYQTAAEAIAHPATDLYTDSDVNLDAATGKLRWYYQGVPDDFKDYDMQTSPITARSKRVDVVIGGGKMGYVYEMNATSGKLMWKTPVGVHNGHDDDSLRALEHRSTLKAPFTIVPGPLGGVLTDLAVARGSIYVDTLDIPVTYTNLNLRAASTGAHSATGEIEALSLATGKVEWDTRFPQLPLGAVTVSNDLVFTALYDGVLVALNRDTGAVVYRRRLPTSENAPIAVAANTVIVPAGGPLTGRGGGGGHPQVVAYRLP
jgi:outer membrane protein assembly factor BamB